MKKTYFVYTIQGYEAELPDGRVNDAVIFELIDTDGDRAIERAKKLVKKKFYRISRVFENFENI